MIFNQELNNFDTFIKDWDTNSEYVLFGASKECIQFIRSMDAIMGNSVLKIKYIVDHLVKEETIVNSIYDINSFYYTGKDKINFRNKIKLIPLESFIENDCKVIITTDLYKNFYKNYLEEKKIKYTWYKNISSIWPYKYKNFVHIYQTDVLITEKCNLNCTFCNMFMPHYISPEHIGANNIINDIDLLFKKVNYISILHLVGGEPFLNPKINDIINHISNNYREKIDKFIITTNGTVTPTETVIKSLVESNIILSISDYSDKLTYIKNKITKNIEKYNINNVKNFVRKEIKWSDFGDLRLKKNLSKNELINHFDNCSAPFRGLNDGKFYYCHLNTSAVRTELFPLNDNDYVDLATISNEELIKFDLGYTNLGYVTFCDNCNGCNTDIKTPVSYEKQGIRKL